MNNEENTKEKSVEELANALTEGMGDEVAADEQQETAAVESENDPVESEKEEEEK